MGDGAGGDGGGPWRKTWAQLDTLMGSSVLNMWWPRCRLIESSLGSVATKLNFFIHNLAQMKFTGSDARPTLSFAPRMHTIKTSGRIRDVFLCRHERVFNPSKGYVSGDSWGQAKGQLMWFCPDAPPRPHVGLGHLGSPSRVTAPALCRPTW